MPRLPLAAWVLAALPLFADAPPKVQPAATAIVGSTTPSFRNDVMPILTRQGCNQGSCHGKGSGQNGFRLSLRGYAPEQDHRWMTREFDGRRINPSAPADSLLLRKPTGSAPHEGGRIFDVGGREYKVLLDWIRAGAPGPKKDDAKLLKLELEPKVRVLKHSEEVPLKATAEFSDG